MKSYWQRWREWLRPGSGREKTVLVTETSRRETPCTYYPGPAHAGVVRPKVFDPALRHFAAGYRAGEPAFADAAVRDRWLGVRAAVMDEALRVIAGSSFVSQLVLRGSRLMTAWFGARARPPGDLDFVIQPDSIRVKDAWTGTFLEGLAEALLRHHWPAGVRVVGPCAVDDIWTYDRVPGKRMSLHWTLEGMPGGQVQMDFVFGERLEPGWVVQSPISLYDGSEVQVPAASREVSLAWKLLWLQTDDHPQGKDLYDAVLLAEVVKLPLALVVRVMQDAPGGRPAIVLREDFPLAWEVDWENFRREYPWVEGEAVEWQGRLATLLRPMFKEKVR